MSVMKKYMIMCMAVMAIMLSSCKNEDISISREVRFEVNPYTVVKDFAKHELNNGDLETPYPGDMVCVSLFVYDNDGYLVDSKKDYFQDYKQTMQATMELPDGNYTAVAITACVESDYNEYWRIRGTERITNLQISYNEDNDYWHSYWDILGITNQQISVSAGHTSYTIDVNPAGSLALNYIQDIHYYNNIYYYVMYGNRDDISFSFNSFGDYTCNSVEDTYFPQQLSPTIWPEDYSNYSGVVRYAFLPSAGRTSFEWEVLLEDEDYGMVYGAISDEKTLNVPAGKTYQFVFSVSTNNFSITELRDCENFDLSGNNMDATICKDRKFDKPKDK